MSTKTEWPIGSAEEDDREKAERLRAEPAPQLRASTPQASELGVWLIEHTYRNQTTVFTTHHPEDIQQYLDRPELYKVTPFYDHAKPCERCAELEAKSELWRKEWKVANSRLIALESSIGELNDSLGALDICQIKPLVTALEAENARLTKLQENASILNKEKSRTIAQQAERIKELEAAIERMRVAGGSAEFNIAFELAKDLL